MTLKRDRRDDVEDLGALGHSHVVAASLRECGIGSVVYFARVKPQEADRGRCCAQGSRRGTLRPSRHNRRPDGQECPSYQEADPAAHWLRECGIRSVVYFARVKPQEADRDRCCAQGSRRGTLRPSRHNRRPDGQECPSYQERDPAAHWLRSRLQFLAMEASLTRAQPVPPASAGGMLLAPASCRNSAVGEPKAG